ncbi:MAG TPA: methyltransferase domain-containing protein [Acidimicrobiales bacterium]|nr:methyltransferase domain-containing protein [Acidimicrobiales bacterium]
MTRPTSDEYPREMGRLFTSVAADYDAVRPGYPATLFDDLAELAGLQPGARVLEIGPGTGIATRSLLDRGWRVHAVEPGQEMAEIARRRSVGHPLRVDVATFEDWEPHGAPFDAAFSATAFHWVHPDVRWTKTATVLAEGGHLALMTNRTVAGNTFHELYEMSEDLHRVHAPGMEDDGPSPPAAELIAELEAAVGDIGHLWSVADRNTGAAPTGGLYEPPVLRTEIWEQEYSADEAVRLLSTFSPYLALDAGRREALFAGIEDLVNEQFGGSVVRRYLSVLAVARRACQPGAT